MNLSPRRVEVLAASGHEATHWSSVGRHDAPDAAIFAFAEMNGYVVLTHDLDFGAILASHKGIKPSVIQIRAQNVDPQLIGAQVIAALRQMTTELTEGALVTVDPNRTRLRVLPFRRDG